ncbi:Flagellar transcriptional regulator FlhC [Tepidimonas sediminis]|uniref:Flagellar transcriptional regulator FlhC n=1 Tax=Tepidimonas sediminis TaxID=2588941 RepID=A0A554WQN2_9BURK|nr:flagellar transcriptional regulator FlhC [Tepidimonas sediminis]TSE25891.1 Flagellar transcriptional regulator FlhC [Tepidimonas sediminis]
MTTATAATPRKTAGRSLLAESRDVERAVQLIQLGARLQVLESETSLSYERLLKLYKEVTGRSPSKGQLPFSTDYFLQWQPNIHASLFENIRQSLLKAVAIDDIDAVMKAYRLYEEQMRACGLEPLLSFTRAWRLSRFMDAGMLTRARCTQCGGHFVADPYVNHRHYVCGLCKPPARAGKGRAQGALRADD